MNSVHWILHQTSHNGNVGSAARAIKTMGFSELVLVNPKDPKAIQSLDAIALASGAENVLQSAVLVNDLSTACQNLPIVFGLTTRDREFGPPSITLKEACQIAVEALANGQSVGYLFGTERTGLENEDLQYCSHRVWIDANPAYSSLNLSQAVMICAYELRQTQIQSGLTNATLLNSTERSSEKATIGAVNAALDHLKEGLEAIEFLDPKHPKKLMERLRAMFDRAQLEKEEIDLIRGIAKQMLNQNQKK